MFESQVQAHLREALPGHLWLSQGWAQEGTLHLRTVRELSWFYWTTLSPGEQPDQEDLTGNKDFLNLLSHCHWPLSDPGAGSWSVPMVESRLQSESQSTYQLCNLVSQGLFIHSQR
jgi:hypothetical protein